MTRRLWHPSIRSGSILPFFVAGRHRLPMIPLLMLAGGYGLVGLTDRAAAKRYLAAACWLGAGVGVALAIFALILTPYVHEPSLAKRACEKSGSRASSHLDTLAAAYADAGRFEEAAETARKAIALAKEAGRAESAARMERRLKLYLAGKPYHERK